MNSRRFLILFVLICLLMFGVWLPANAAPSLQQYLTPTPGADGRILYVVKPGDNCFVVATLHNISVEQLRQLNSKLDENCTVTEGQELLIGVVSPATSTPEAVTSLGTPTITPTPLSGTTEICALIYDDVNGNAVREEIEPAVAGGAVSVTEINGAYSASLETVIPADSAAFQGICFVDVPEGNYNITVAIPENYNATTSLNSTLDVNAGDTAYVPFGIQSQDVVVDNTATDKPQDGQSTLLGIIGGILLLGGVGLGYYAYRTSRPESKLSGGGYLRK
jgi:hypothetical protein